MQESLNASKPPAALQVPLTLVDYVKSVALYPPGNHRIAKNCAATIEAVRVAIEDADEDRPDYRFVFQGKDFVCGEARTPCDADPRLDWLRTRFDMSALAGIAIRKDADEEALGVFADRFLEIIRSRPKNPAFDELWEESMLGISPLERRYDGQYDLENDFDREDIADWLMQGSDGSKLLIEMLRRSGRIAKRVHSIEERLKQLAEERQLSGKETEGIEVDVLDQVLRSLPLELLGDGPAIVKVVDDVLSQLEQSIANSALDTGSFELDKLMGKLSQRFFQCAEPPASEVRNEQSRSVRPATRGTRRSATIRTRSSRNSSCSRSGKAQSSAKRARSSSVRSSRSTSASSPASTTRSRSRGSGVFSEVCSRETKPCSRQSPPTT